MHASHLASLVWRGGEASEHATGCWKPSLNVALLTTRGRELTTSERARLPHLSGAPRSAHIAPKGPALIDHVFRIPVSSCPTLTPVDVGHDDTGILKT